LIISQWTPDPGPLLAAITSLLPGLTLDELTTLTRLLPDRSLLPGPLAAQVTARTADLMRPEAAARPDAFTADLAGSLNNLSVHLSGLGRREEALGAVEEAVDLYRGAFTSFPAAFARPFSTSLLVFCLIAVDAGMTRKVVERGAEALVIESQYRLEDLIPPTVDALRRERASNSDNFDSSWVHVGGQPFPDDRS
jgi:hypothetical protein